MKISKFKDFLIDYVEATKDEPELELFIYTGNYEKEDGGVLLQLPKSLLNIDVVFSYKKDIEKEDDYAILHQHPVCKVFKKHGISNFIKICLVINDYQLVRDKKISKEDVDNLGFLLL